MKTPLVACLFVSLAVVAGSCRLARQAADGPGSATTSVQLAAPRGKPFLNMGPDDKAPLPRTLSATGAFADTAALVPAASLIPYELNVPFYSDGAAKRRWLSLPSAPSLPPAGPSPDPPPTIHAAPTDKWTFPTGTVFVKHFEFPAAQAGGAPRRVETRILVRDAHGFVYGASYRWRPDGRDADLVPVAHTEQITVDTPDGPRVQPYYLPGPKDCRACHTPASGGVLGVNTRQLNRDVVVDGRAVNQLAHLAGRGLFDAPLADPATLPRLVSPADETLPLEARVRSYLDANCAQCHRPGTEAQGAVSDFDARLETPLAEQGLLNARVRLAQGVDRARIVAPHDPWRSVLLLRTETLETTKMPPLGRMTVDAAGVQLLRQWILSLPGPDVLDPPALEPTGGDFPRPVAVTLRHADAAATIHYTMDGTVPTEVSPAYTGPLTLRQPTVVRAAAFKPGATRSITVQQVYSVAE
jgi:uncharacterized repeat protein (TIGR03806 family)